MVTKTQMSNTPEMSATLKEMWRINNKVAAGEEPTIQEIDFFNSNLHTIERYYTSRSNYWKIQTGLKYAPKISSSENIAS